MPPTYVVALLLIGLFVALRLSRLLDRKPPRPAENAVRGIEVRICSRNAFVDAVTRAGAGLMLLGLAIALVFFLAGSVRTGIAVAILSTGLPLLGIANFWLAHSGWIELREDRLVIRARNALHEYPWAHVTELRTGTWAESGRAHRAFIRSMGARVDEPYVYLQLDRAVHMSMGIWHSRYGTEISGLPMMLSRIMLFVDEPKAFVELARPYVDASPLDLAA